jgi:hypothetical protein
VTSSTVTGSARSSIKLLLSDRDTPGSYSALMHFTGSTADTLLAGR